MKQSFLFIVSLLVLLLHPFCLPLVLIKAARPSGTIEPCAIRYVHDKRGGRKAR